MPRAPRFWGPRAFGGPALLGGPRFWGARAFGGPALLGTARFWGPRVSLFYFFLNFLFPVSARGPNSAPVRGPKEPKSPRKLEAPQNRPQTGFFWFLVLVFQRGAPKSPRSPENVIGPQNLKIEAPKCGAPNDFFVPCFRAGSKQRGALKSPRPPKAKAQPNELKKP